MNRARGRRPAYTWALAGMLWLAACNASGPAPHETLFADSTRARFTALIEAGDSVYAEKRGLRSFSQSLKYFDAAQAIADRSGDTLLIAEAAFAKGRVYDGWNKEPQKTIEYFTRAAGLLKGLPGKEKRYFYAKHLVAHAYDKVKDSANAARVLKELFKEIAPLPDSTKQGLKMASEMALIATEVHAYPLADSILRYLTARAWIANDPTSYDYLNHYYLTQSRLDAFWRRPAHSYYLDSLQSVFSGSANILDRQYYSFNIAELFAAAGKSADAYRYLRINTSLSDSINNSSDLVTMQSSLLQSELTAERRKAEYEEAMRAGRLRTIWGLSLCLAVITVLSIYLYRKSKGYKEQSRRLATLNEALDKQVGQVELLNKEIQHRVKNNLHMIYSLLHMQERKTDNEETIEALQAARLRVESIAALHNQLLAGKGSLDFGDFIRSLISSVVNCLSDEKKVVTHISAVPIAIPVNSCFALSLVLNEWVTNSIKYAATPSNLIEIKVGITARPDDVCIEYSDSGSPELAHKPVGGSHGLGSQIVALLSRQMGAALSTIGNNPYHYHLCIPHGA